MGYALLALAICLELCGTVCMKLSDGFSKWIPSVLIFVFYGLSFATFAMVLKYVEISVAYAIWAGLGVVLISLVGIAWFGEPLTVMKVAATLCIVVGVVTLQLSANQTPSEEPSAPSAERR